MSSVSDITALATLALGYKMLSGLGFLGFGGEETTDEKLGTGVAGAKYFRDSPLASGDPAETCDYDMKCDTRSDLKKYHLRKLKALNRCFCYGSIPQGRGKCDQKWREDY